MTIGDMTFKLGGVPPVELHLASSDGLAPLELPQPLPRSLPQPSPDAIRRFQSAMEEGGSRLSRPPVGRFAPKPPPEKEAAKSGLEKPVYNGSRLPRPPGGSRFSATGAARLVPKPPPENPSNRSSPIIQCTPSTPNTPSNQTTQIAPAPPTPTPARSDGGLRASRPTIAETSTDPDATEPPPAPLPLAQPPPAPPPPASATPVSKAEAVARVVDEIVEAVSARILVTPALAQGEGEIRITLGPAVLGGSEIHLTAKAGELTVAITPATQEAAQTAAAAVHRLESALAGHAPAFHHVAVVVAPAKKGKMNETA